MPVSRSVRLGDKCLYHEEQRQENLLNSNSGITFDETSFVVTAEVIAEDSDDFPVGLPVA